MTDLGPTNSPLPGAVQRLMAGAGALGRGPAPVHLWNPPYCGEIDMRIAADGTWFYNGSAIRRPAMVKLFSTILRKDSSGFVLVTPVERVGIRVDDAPFLAVEAQSEAGAAGERLYVRTNLDDVIEISDEHPIRFTVAGDGGLKPYIHVRGDLWALASRALTHELIGRCTVELSEKPTVLGGETGLSAADTAVVGRARPKPRPCLGLRSGSAFFPLAEADETGALA